MSLLVAFGAGKIDDRQINEDRWPSCTPFVWAHPEEGRTGARESDRGVLFFLSADFRSTQSSPIGTRFAGVGTHGSIKSEARRNLPLEVALAFPMNDRFGWRRFGHRLATSVLPDQRTSTDRSRISQRCQKRKRLFHRYVDRPQTQAALEAQMAFLKQSSRAGPNDNERNQYQHRFNGRFGVGPERTQRNGGEQRHA
jgi:hypothetical protein